ncbi:usp-like protein isoform 2 [Plakobranchus ocellatus]|uniref:Usp-like protein isoform 2 n=1 Tax=Plakobranchus ocellatus TaxID=259542 RepID=A0AAV4ANT9_9GAST|nr:usp-like protein isoform 2 [Plakobranchus ocellatus]
MPRTVIIAVDDSAFSEYAFDFYCKYVMFKTDKIILVHVSEYTSLVQAPVLMTDPIVVAELIKEEEFKVKRLVDKFSDKMKQLHLGGKVKQMAGKSGEAIIAAAKEEHAELIVMGTRGMGTLRRTFIGSVSDYVLHHAHVPVMICRQPEQSHAKDHH